MMIMYNAFVIMVLVLLIFTVFSCTFAVLNMMMLWFQCRTTVFFSSLTIFLQRPGNWKANCALSVSYAIINNKVSEITT